MARDGWRQVDCSTRMDQQQRTLVDQMSWTWAGLRSRFWRRLDLDSTFVHGVTKDDMWQHDDGYDEMVTMMR